MPHRFLKGSVVGGFVVAAAAALIAGPLNPPAGPVTSTYKTLSEIEPRTAINAINTPGDPTSLYIISQPGSYYLSGNVTGVAGKHGLTINSVNVTVDLNGFGMLGIPGSLAAITDGGSNHGNTTLRGGSIIGWGGAGVDLASSFDSILSDLIVTNNGGFGVTLGDAAVVRDCLSRDNAGTNIDTGFNANLSRCTAVGSSTLHGINLGRDSLIDGCVANFNWVGGIRAEANCTVTRCTAVQNNFYGISAENDSTVTDSTARLNAVDGIQCYSRCLIRGNSCTGNGTGSSTGAGVVAAGDHNRIEANACSGADYGIHVLGTGNRIDGNSQNTNSVNIRVVGINNIITRNTATGGAPNYSVVAGNSVAPRVSVTANDGWVGITNADHPFANFGY